MNYFQYEQKIVKSFGVALDGWPLDGHICNPGGLAARTPSPSGMLSLVGCVSGSCLLKRRLQLGKSTTSNVLVNSLVGHLWKRLQLGANGMVMMVSWWVMMLFRLLGVAVCGWAFDETIIIPSLYHHSGFLDCNHTAVIWPFTHSPYYHDTIS
jgi:hypothetical protein